MRATGRRPGWLLVVAGLVALLVLGLGGAWGLAQYEENAKCTDEKRAIFGEFPQYGGREIKPEPDIATNACVVRFTTTDPEEEVFAYYSERLRENGWEIESEPPPYSKIVESTDPEATVPALILMCLEKETDVDEGNQTARLDRRGVRAGGPAGQRGGARG